MRRITATLAAAAAVTVLAGCSGGGEAKSSPPPAASTGPTATAAAAEGTPEATGDPDGAARIVDEGFGQEGEYAWATSVVEVTGPAAVGRFLTVQFNLLDAAGEIVASEEQVESSAWLGQRIAIGTQITVGAKKAVDVEATLVVGLETNTSSSGPYPVKASQVKVVADDVTGGWKVHFLLENPPGAPMAEEPRVGIVCRDAKKRIVGGGSEYPPSLKPGGKTLADGSIIASGKPASCEVYPGPGGF